MVAETVTAIAAGLSAITSLVRLIKGGPDAPAAVDAVTSSIVAGMQAVSKGGQADTWREAALVLKPVQGLIKDSMTFAESTGLPGDQKQAIVTKITTDALDIWQASSKGPQVETATVLAPVIRDFVDANVPILFPKDEHPGDASGTGTVAQ